VRTILIGLMAAIPLIGTACGDDDGGSVFGQLEEDASPQDDTVQDDSDQMGNPAGDPYPPEVQQQFMDACTSQPGATAGACQCSLDHIMANVSFDEFVAMEQDMIDNPGVTPQPVQDAIAACT
jgi:hypothetical protein